MKKLLTLLFISFCLTINFSYGQDLSDIEIDDLLEELEEGSKDTFKDTKIASTTKSKKDKKGGKSSQEKEE